MRAHLWTAVLITALVGVIAVTRFPQPPVDSRLPARDGPSLADARTWGYQLQAVDPARIAADIDVLVVDVSRDGTPSGTWTPAEIAALRQRPDGRPRIVLCYLSIGEAENYRGYWQPSWSARAPAWLGPENPAWKGNFSVDFWHPDWQRLIIGEPLAPTSLLGRWRQLLWPAPPAALSAVLAAGFDGVYLDRVDAYERSAQAHPAGREEMIEFVRTISQISKTHRPGFLVVPQNAEELLADAGYRAAIDGAGKEDLFFGEAGDGVENDPAAIRYSIALLQHARGDGKPVFVVEYLADVARQHATMANLAAVGFVGLFAERGLKLPPQPPPAPAAAQTPPPKAAAIPDR